jgi:alpha-L-rhamnosidase
VIKEICLQSAYELSVNDGKNNVWKSGKITSENSVHVAYAGEALKSNTKYTGN